MCDHSLLAKISIDGSVKEHNNIILCHFSTLGLETLMLLNWMCCVCAWCMWRTGLPKWINTITSSRWPWHFVPFPVIVLMLYWLLLSGEQRLHAALPLPSTHLHRSHTLLSVNPQSIFHRALEWLFHKLIGHTSHRLTLKVWWGTWEEDSKVDINTSGPILNAQTQKPVHSISISWLASPSAPATLCSHIYSGTIC